MIKYTLRMRCMKVKIEVWMDFTCPFCYIGKRKLDIALEKFQYEDFVKIECKSYELAPNAANQTNEKIHSVLMNKYGLTVDRAKEMMSRVERQAEEVGILMNVDDLEHVNTLNAHRLVKYAEKQGRDDELINLLFESYFTKNDNIADREVLIAIAKEANLDEQEVDALLCLNKYQKAVRMDEQLAKDLDINGVPFFVFNEQYALSGMQPVHVLLTVLEEIWQEEEPHVKNNPGEQCTTTYCTGDECE